MPNDDWSHIEPVPDPPANEGSPLARDEERHAASSWEQERVDEDES